MIRKAQKQDISRIAEIIIFGKRVAYRSIFHNDEVSFNELKVVDLIRTYEQNSELLDHTLVYDDGIVKGTIFREYKGNYLEIENFYVEPFFVGEGIGRELIMKVIEEAKQRKISRIFLWVISDNAKARRFYERNGFVKTGETQAIEGTDKIDLGYEMVF